jgi:uncharacterized protein (DUF697 family)/tellurite resistance protein
LERRAKTLAGCPETHRLCPSADHNQEVLWRSENRIFSNDMPALTSTETNAILTICLMASFADGEKHDREREQIKQMTESLTEEGIDAAALYRKVLLNKPEIETVTADLVSAESRQLAYEMAVCVCDADDVCNAAETQFLLKLRAALALPGATTQVADVQAAALATVPVATPAAPATEETDGMITRYAIVGGALELLPQTMATLAIVPLQTKMVYRIGKQHGFELDRRSIGEFMATIGIGLASQVFEGFARRLTKGFGKTLAGKLGGKIGDAAGGIAMSFASTYALGQLAKMYYGGGRSLSLESLKAKYPPLLAEGKTLALKYTSQITDQSRKLQGADIATLIKGVV